jgi:hypothetical protein
MMEGGMNYEWIVFLSIIRQRLWRVVHAARRYRKLLVLSEEIAGQHPETECWPHHDEAGNDLPFHSGVPESTH